MRASTTLVALLCLGSPSAVSAQEGEPAFYRYNGSKVTLTPASDMVAAKVLERVEYRSKFPELEKQFAIVGSAALKDEPVLVQAAGVGTQESEQAIEAGVRTKEIYKLQVFELGDARVIVQNELIVGFKPGQTADDAETLIRRFSRTFARQPGERLRYLVRVPDPGRTLAWAELLYQNRTVAYAEPNLVILQPSRPSNAGAATESAIVPAALETATASPAAVFPSDLLFGRQWALEKIEAPKAWDTTRGAPTIRVAILDDGVDVEHPDLRDKIESAFDMIFDSSAMQPSASDAHGTAVAGIAAAMTNNRLGIAGVAPEVKLIPIRMMSSIDATTEANTLAIISNAFQKAVELGADVINCSWTMGIPSQDVEEAIKAALTLGRNGRGSVVVFAAGNAGRPVAFPASVAIRTGAIAVGASNERDEFKTSDSSDGERNWASNFGAEITVVAPGVHMVTTTHRLAVRTGAEPFIAGFNGTSSAAPLVSGLAALLLSASPDLTAEQVKARIVSSAEAVVVMPDQTRVGRVNACRALGRTDCRS